MRTIFIVALISFCLFSVYLEIGPRPQLVKAQSQWAQNRYVIECFFRNKSNPKVILVGSSLSKRLDISSPDQCLYDLALSGGSVLTGLKTVVESQQRPHAVFVEINVPQRPLDLELISDARNYLRRLSPILYTENNPVNLLTSFLFQLGGGATELAVQKKVFENALALNARDSQILIPDTLLHKNILEITTYTKILKSRGVPVVFFEMPIHPSLENNQRPLQVRNSFQRSSFPSSLFLDWKTLASGAQIHTSDGIHLLRDEAKVVINNLRIYIEPYCKQ